MDREAFERKIFDLVGYMATSGRNLIDETPLYGPFRLVDAASRLIEILEQEGIGSSRLSTLRERIDAGKYAVMVNAEEFKNYLDAVIDAVVDHMDSGTSEGGEASRTTCEEGRESTSKRTGGAEK